MSASKNWITYWNTEQTCADVNWQTNMDIFMKYATELMVWKPEDEVLDIGCGPGFLPKALVGKVKGYTGLDTAKRYVEKGKAEFADRPFSFHFLGEDYLNFDMLGDQQFDVVVCMSVVQYYKDAGEVEKLLREILKRAKTDTRIMIADVPLKKSVLSDVFGFLWTGLVEGCLWQNLKFMWRLKFSKDHKDMAGQGLLVLSKTQWADIIKNLGLEKHQVMWAGRMTVNARRENLFIRVLPEA